VPSDKEVVVIDGPVRGAEEPPQPYKSEPHAAARRDSVFFIALQARKFSLLRPIQCIDKVSPKPE
jgi:hypothetical protein